MNAIPPPLPPPTVTEATVPASPRFAFTLKLLFVGALALVLLVPLSLVKSLLRERQTRQMEAVSSITETWSDAQTLVGPVLVVPYRTPGKVRHMERVEEGVKPVEGTTWAVARACFLPTHVAVTGTLAPSRLHRGIYEAVVYRSALTITGAFAAPDFSEWKIDPANILWDEAVILISVSDLRGVTDALSFQLGGTALPMGPGGKVASFDSPLRARVPAQAFAGGEPAPFTLELKLNGSGGLRVAPVGMQTQVTLDSPWSDPSFQGTFLPLRREVTPSGFKAAWEVSYYGRAFPQAWLDADYADAASALTRCAFGVSLMTPVDSYRLVERATKYGVLFVVLLFTGFFLFETLARLRIHPLQYMLVGAALCLFYLALLSLSELLSFVQAYLAAAAGATVLIVGYSAAVLSSRLRAATIGLELTLIYAFLYITLQLQDYALVFGTVGLFLTLAVVMFATRRVNWYEVR